MRILVANDGLSDAGGVDTYLRAVSSRLHTRGHRIARLHCAAETPFRDLPDTECWSVGALGLERAVALAARWRPDVCFSHNMRALAVERALFAVAPVVKMMHGYFGTCVSGLKSFGWPERHPCSRVLGTACLGLYLPRRCGRLNPLRMSDEYQFAIGQRALFPQYRSVVVASRHMKQEYVRGGALEERVHAIPLFAPAVDEHLLEPRVDAPVLFIGRMTALKGGDLLVRAIAAAERLLNRRVALVMAGDGPERVTWTALARQLSVDVTFTGWIDRDRVRTLLGRASLLAVPSTWPEPFGLVGLEAAASAVPSVAFDLGGISEWLHDGHNGIFAANYPDAPALAGAIARVLGDRALHGHLSAGALTTARTMTIDRHLDALERVFGRACDVTPAPA